MNDIILKPILTEKMADLGERLNRYAFEVNSKSNKIEIKNAIEIIKLRLLLEISNNKIEITNATEIATPPV